MAVRRTPTPKRKSKARPPKSPLPRYMSSRGAAVKRIRTLREKTRLPQMEPPREESPRRQRKARPPISLGAKLPSRSSRGTLSASFRKALKTAAAKAATPRRKKAREAASVGRGTKTTSLRSPSRSIRGKSVSRRRAGGTPSRRAN